MHIRGRISGRVAFLEARILPHQWQSADTYDMRILLVEDEPSQQEALGIALTVSGHTVVPATDVPEALALIDDPLDAAILDVRLPDPSGLNRDGLTVLSELRARQPNIPIAVFTGIPLSDAEEVLAQSHTVSILYKPQTLDRIFDFLTQHLAQSATRNAGDAQRARKRGTV